MVIAAEPVKVESVDYRSGKDGILPKLFANMLESIREEDLTDHPGNEPYETKGRNSNNRHIGFYSEKEQRFGKD